MNLDWYKSLEWFQKTKKIRKVLFVCSGNAGRSPSAEYFFNHMTRWWSGVKAFSRGVNVKKILAELQAKGIDINELMADDEVKKIIGDKTSSFLKKHKAKQVSTGDIVRADLVLTMEKGIRNDLRKEFPDQAYKIFTLKGFVEQSDDKTIAELNVYDPFILPAVRSKKGIVVGKTGYLKYLKDFMKMVEFVKAYVRKVIEIIYLLKAEK